MKVYVEMLEICSFIIEAESEEEAHFWAQTHTVKDVQEKTTQYTLEYEEHTCEVAEVNDAAFDI